VEVDAAHGALVLLVLFQQRAHAVVPQLDHAVVQRGEDPGPLGVEGEALHAVALGVKLGEHGCSSEVAQRRRREERRGCRGRQRGLRARGLVGGGEERLPEI
jgi:hypothetical protein